MSLADTIADLWRRHDAEPDAVAAEIEACASGVVDASQAIGLTHLANHVIGRELQDWHRAVHVVGSVLSNASGTLPAAATGNLAVAQYMAGDTLGGLGTEARLAADAPGDALAHVARVRALVAEALVGVEKWDEALRLIDVTLDLAEVLPPGHAAERTLAVTCNNLASELLEWTGRTTEHSAVLERLALAARKQWLRCGDWRNDERADYLLVLVYNELDRPADARALATRALATIAGSGDEPVDAAFLHSARAASLVALGDDDGATADVREAERLGEAFAEAEWKQRLADQLAKLLRA